MIKNPYKKYNGLDINEISRLTGKSRTACRVYINKHPNTRTIEAIKNGTRKRSNQKYYIKGVPLKERCKKEGLTYRQGLYRVNKRKKIKRYKALK